MLEIDDGDRIWKNSKNHLHRIDGPAIEYVNGTKCWYIDGELHREDGPALEWSDGHKRWFLNGKRHRVDGPAIEYSNGSKEWYLDGKEYSEAEYREKVKDYVRDR